MKQGKCPKCNSSDVRSSIGVKNRTDGASGSIQIGGGWLPRTATFDTYVCINCGYVESYISDKAKLKLISDRWPRAGMEYR